jgi:hypothetical protein
MVIQYMTKDHHVDNITFLPKNAGGIISTLRSEVSKYYFLRNIKKYKNMIKYAKRLWTLADTIGDQESKKVQEKIIYLYRSDYNILNQVKSELDVIRDMLEKLDNPPIKILYNQANQTINTITKVIQTKIDKTIYKDLTDIGNHKYNKDKVISMLKNISEYFKNIDDKGAEEYLTKVGLWPAPKKYVDASYVKFIFA